MAGCGDLPAWVLLLGQPPAAPKPTPIRVSTMTAIGDVCAAVDLTKFFNEVPLEEVGAAGVIYVEMASETSGLVWRGDRQPSAIISAKRRLARRKRAESVLASLPSILVDKAPPPIVPRSQDRHFDNQVTMAVRTADGGLLNVKLFKNGRVQLTGLKRVSHGPEAVGLLKDALTRMELVSSPGVVRAKGGALALGIGEFRICMINSDFRLGFDLRRDILFAKMRAAYATVCSFEPCIYPGVKIEYMWNADPPTVAMDGVCQCYPETGQRCNGKGEGNGVGCCRKVTIAVFQSGSVIITGAHTLDQIDDAYNFITTVTTRHFNEIRIIHVEPVRRFSLLPKNGGGSSSVKGCRALKVSKDKAKDKDHAAKAKDNASINGVDNGPTGGEKGWRTTRIVRTLCALTDETHESMTPRGDDGGGSPLTGLAHADAIGDGSCL